VSDELHKDHLEKYDTDLRDIQLHKAEWYPSGLVYYLNMSRNGLKKAKGIKKFHRLL
jgi:hypothetical protein